MGGGRGGGAQHVVLELGSSGAAGGVGVMGNGGRGGVYQEHKLSEEDAEWLEHAPLLWADKFPTMPAAVLDDGECL